MNRLSFLVWGMLPALMALMSLGCQGSNTAYLTPERMDRGLVIILPGIEGESTFNRDIRRGLEQSGLYCAMPIHHWGRPIPIAGPLINQVDVLGNRLAGKGIARSIVDYRNSYPGRPVYVVGHSGGGGVAIFAVEALPDGYEVDGVVLLSASISAGYNLTEALQKSRHGIVSFFSRADVGLLVVGTTLAGNVDGARGPGAGAFGFDLPKHDADPGRLQAYHKLYQVGLDSRKEGGFLKAHSSTTRMGFVAYNVAPWICSSHWPPGTPAVSKKPADDAAAKLSAR